MPEFRHPVFHSLLMKIFRSFFFLLLFFIPFKSTVFAYDLGPFTFRGFVLGQYSWSNSQCIDCQKFPDEDRQRVWADELLPNQKTTSGFSPFSLFQPYIDLRPIYLGQGFNISAMLSQRWRDGMEDIPGIIYERNITLEHEYYGKIQIGAFPSRGWAVADYPYGASIGLADAWGSSGSGYGLLGNAFRYSAAVQDYFRGEFRWEITYDIGDSRYKSSKNFIEFFGQYAKGDLVTDWIYQIGKNGRPGSWTHGPFLGLTDDPKYDNGNLPENTQTILLGMFRYQLTNQLEVSTGVRRNYWSGTDAVMVAQDEDGVNLWNNMFNVDWNASDKTNADYGTLYGGVYKPSYPAMSYDFMLGGRYRPDNSWTYSAGFVHLTAAVTENPMDRGQNNNFTISRIGVGYSGLYPGVTVSFGAGMIRFKQKGLAPLSMPSHSAFGGVDSRVSSSGENFGAEALYVF